MVRNILIATAMFAIMTVAAAPSWAQFGTGNSANHLFAQYQTQPGASMTTAGMYPAPHHVPANVGHTYYTYQPLMPHEMMYQHTRNYYNYYNTGGYYGGNNALNKTQVRWQSGSNHMGPMPFSGAAFQSLQWKYQKKKYCLGDECEGQRGGGRLRGKFGHYGGECAGGDCGSVYGGDSIYTGDVYGGGCAGGGCSANASNEASNSLQR